MFKPTSNNKLISFNDLDIELVRSRRKTLSIEIGNQSIKARAPLRMSEKSIMEFLHSKHDWIKKHSQGRPAPLDDISLVDGAKLFIQNQPYILKVINNQRGKIELDGMRIILPIIQSNRPLADSIKDKLIRWYKETALLALEQRIAYYAPLMGLSSSDISGIKVREYKRRWGCCDHTHKLSFNWRIIMAPAEVLDYVVIHELAHCHEFNHSKRFWQIVATQMPNWQEKQDWLQKNGVYLYRF